MLIVADNNPTRHIRLAFVNWAVILACVFLFVAQIDWTPFAFTPAHLHLVSGPKAPGGAPEIIGTMVSYLFFHATPLHLAGNMLALWVFGDNIEDSMGHWRYALFLALTAAAGAGGEALFSPDPNVPIIGASGAIAGVMGAYLLLHPRARVMVLAGIFPVLVPAGIFVGLSIALDILSATAIDTPNPEVLVAYWAHIGGFVMGALLILILRLPDVPLFQPAQPYPERGFLGLGRFAIDLGTARFTLGSRALFWIKALVFFVLIAIVGEAILA